MRIHRKILTLVLASAALAGLNVPADAQFVVNWGFAPNTTVPDNSSQGFVNTLGGFASYSNITVSLNLTSAGGNTMFLGDMYANLTLGDALLGETQRTAVLLNRPGRDGLNKFGSSASSLNVTLDDSITQPSGNVWASNGAAGRYNSDGRMGVSPNGAGVAFDPMARNATLAALNGTAFASNRFSLLVADYSPGGVATLANYGYGVTGAAASSGTLDGNGGTFSISDTGSSAVNNVGAAIDITQAGGGALSVNVAGTMTFSAGVSGTGGLTKSGTGTLTLSNATGNTYSGTTTVNAGTLLVINSTSGSGTGSGAITLNNSGTLGGNGFINAGANAITVNSGGTLRGGDGSAASGALSITGAVTMATGSIIELALGAAGAHSTLAITGSLSFASAQAFHFLDFGAGAGMYNNIITGVADPGTGITGWTITNDGWTGTFSWDGANIDLNLSVVPEPSTWAAGILVAAALVYSQRKRLYRLFRPAA